MATKYQISMHLLNGSMMLVSGLKCNDLISNKYAHERKGMGIQVS